MTGPRKPKDVNITEPAEKEAAATTGGSIDEPEDETQDPTDSSSDVPQNVPDVVEEFIEPVASEAVAVPENPDIESETEPVSENPDTEPEYEPVPDYNDDLPIEWGNGAPCLNCGQRGYKWTVGWGSSCSLCAPENDVEDVEEVTSGYVG